MQEVENLWSKIWEDNKTHNVEASWINIKNKCTKNKKNRSGQTSRQKRLYLAGMKSSNWKAPGNDGIANFWIKHLTSVHEELTIAYLRNKTCFLCLHSLVKTEVNVWENSRADQ